MSSEEVKPLVTYCLELKNVHEVKTFERLLVTVIKWSLGKLNNYSNIHKLADEDFTFVHDHFQIEVKIKQI